MPNYPIWRGLPGRDGAATLPAGTQGQVIGYGPDGAPVAVDLPDAEGYDDTALTQRVAAVEARPVTPAYNDAPLVARIAAVEAAPAAPVPTGLRVSGGKLYLDMSNGTALEVTLPTGGTQPAQVAPAFTTQPRLTGSTALGSTITLDLGAASGTPAPTLTGSLTRPGKAAVAVQQGATFVIDAADQGGTAQLVATATNSAGTVQATGTLVVPAATVAPAFTTQPSLTGGVTLNSVVTISLGAASGNPTPTLTGTLTRPGRAAVAVVDGATFTVEAADQGGTVQLEVVSTNSVGSVTASASRVIPAAATPLSFPTLVTIGDSFTAGQGATTTAARYANIVAGRWGSTLLNKGVGNMVLQNSVEPSGAPRAVNGRNQFLDDAAGPNKRDAVLIAFGINDARYNDAPGEFNLTNFRGDLAEVITGLRQNGYPAANIILVSPHYITDAGLAQGYSGKPAQTRAAYEQYVAAAEAIARENGVIWANTYTYMRDNGGGSLIGADNIHPNDSGMTAIADAITTTGARINSRAAPEITSWAATGGNLILQYGAVSGATGYEVQTGLMGSFTFGASVAQAGTSYSYAAPDGKVYAARVRAMFGQEAGPWAIVTDGASTSSLLLDTFTTSQPERTTAHAAESGGLWVQNRTQTGNSGTIQGGGVFSSSANTVCLLKGASQVANGYVEGDLRLLGTVDTAQIIGIVFRASETANTQYMFQFYRSDNTWRLGKSVNNTFTAIASQPATVAIGTDYVMRVEFSGSNIVCKVDGATVISTTDTALTSGWCGYRAFGSSTLTDGARLMRFAAGAA